MPLAKASIGKKLRTTSKIGQPFFLKYVNIPANNTWRGWFLSTYVIGDVQGCFTQLQQLLSLISFNPQRDRLGFVGDLVNRGPDSLAVLRFIKSLNNPWVVLGNHDIYLLAIGYQAVHYTGSHTLQQILAAEDKDELLDWLRRLPLLSYDPSFDTILVHAGIPPQWTLAEAKAHAQEVEQLLSGADFKECLRHIEGIQPLKWENNLEGWPRMRYIINALTRMRFCTHDGTLNLANKSRQSDNPQTLRPWFEWYKLPHRVVYGHWAALEGKSTNPLCEALDTGCVYGNALTAYRLEDKKRFSVPGLLSHSLK